MEPRYRPRQARASPLWQCLHSALPEFILHYPERHAPRVGADGSASRPYHARRFLG